MVTCLHNLGCWDQGSQDQDSSVLNACIQWAYCSQQYWLHLSKSQSQYIVSVMRALGFSFKFGNIMPNWSWQFPLWNLPASAKKVWVTLVKASMLLLQSRQHWNEAHQPMGADWLLKCGWCSCLFISMLCDLWCQRFAMWTVCHDVLWMVQCETFEWCDFLAWGWKCCDCMLSQWFAAKPCPGLFPGACVCTTQSVVVTGHEAGHPDSMALIGFVYTPTTVSIMYVRITLWCLHMFHSVMWAAVSIICKCVCVCARVRAAFCSDSVCALFSHDYCVWHSVMCAAF